MRACSRCAILPTVRFVAFLVGCAAMLVGCARKPENVTPEGAVRELTSRLEALDGGEGDARAVYDLLSERAQVNLQARAERYSNASGRQIAAWAMIVPSRSRLRFVPQSYQAKVAGKYALVEVLGVSADQAAQIPCVREKNLWHVDLNFPELAPLVRRTGVPTP